MNRFNKLFFLSIIFTVMFVSCNSKSNKVDNYKIQSSENRFDSDKVFQNQQIDIDSGNVLYLIKKAYGFDEINFPVASHLIENGKMTIKDSLYIYDVEKDDDYINIEIFSLESEVFVKKVFLQIKDDNLYLAATSNQFASFSFEPVERNYYPITVIDKKGSRVYSKRQELIFGQNNEESKSVVIPLKGMTLELRNQINIELQELISAMSLAK